jgi:hypothetical protein
MPSFSKYYREDLIYPELSYSIVGLAYEAFNELGAGHLEKNVSNSHGKSIQSQEY